MTTIVHLASSGELGGAERVILDALTGLLDLRPQWSLHLVVPSDGPLARRARAARIGVAVAPWSGAVAELGEGMAKGHGRAGFVLRLGAALPGVARDAARLARVLAGLRPSLVHAHGFKMQLLGLWTRPQEAPLILHLHDYLSTRKFMSRALRVRPPGPLHAVAISKSVADDAGPILGARARTDIVYNGVDTDEWRADGPVLDVDAAAGLEPAARGTVRVGLVATMARWKGHETFLRALSALPPDLPVRGYIVGGSIYRSIGSQRTISELKAIANDLGLSRRVGFTGFVDDPVSAMRALDVVVHASVEPEPFGRVIVEGMATGRAVIARALGGAAELFVPDVEAVACVTSDPAELTAAIARLVSDPPLRARLGAAGRRRVERDFSRAQMAASLATIYEGVLSGPHGAPRRRPI